MFRLSPRAAALAFAAVLAALPGCVTPPRVKPAPRAPAPTARQHKVNDQRFYMAVDAYANGDYAAADGYVDEILKVSPGDKDALALRSRLRAAERAAGPH